MGACKEEVLLKIEGSGAPVVNVDAAVDFLTEKHKFNMDRLWSSQVHDYNIIGGTPRLTLLVSNTNVDNDFVSYKTKSTDVDISDPNNRFMFDDDMPPLYFRFQYVANGAIGSFSLNFFEANDG